MVVGDRISNGTYRKENKRLFHDFGNNLVKKTINKLFKNDLKDIMSGYRIFNKIFIKNMPILSDGFEIETEMTLYALDKRFIIKEIPIIYRDRIEGSNSKLNTVSDGIKVIKKIISMFKDYKPRKFFFSIAIILLIIGILIRNTCYCRVFQNKIYNKITISCTCNRVCNTWNNYCTMWSYIRYNCKTT